MNNSQILLGLDIGTGGVRALAVTASGEVVARSTAPFPAPAPQPDGIHEQDPAAWWDAVSAATSQLMAELKRQTIRAESILGVSVDGTSGTFVCLDSAHKPLRPAMMYNDARATDEADKLNEAALDFCDKLGYKFAPSYALAKILWIRSNEPNIFDHTAGFLHQADYIADRLTGDFNTTDYSNALKTGYDLVDEAWPDWLDAFPGVRERLPDVVAPGTLTGRVSASAADSTGLPEGLQVLAGASDGTAACLASGVRQPGDYNTTLGTTLVLKGVSRAICKHPDGLIYCHKLPGGYWLPGGASNTGCEWINTLFKDADLAALDQAAAAHLPNPAIAYPLVRKGERFPFLAPQAQGFCVPEPADEVERYAANLQGVAFLERIAFDVVDAAARTSGGQVFSAGGGSAGNVWMQCRADVAGRLMHRPACPESAFGSAILAASGTVHGDLWTAIRHMVRLERSFEPNPARRSRYDELFERFKHELETRGYW